MSGVEDVLRIPRRADLVECRNQGILAVAPERHVEVDRHTSGRVAQALPVVGDGLPRVLHFQLIPTWCEECRKADKGNDSEGEEHSEAMLAHGYRRSLDREEGQTFRETSG